MSVKKSQGFTLIELMITVLIVGLLMAIALPAYANFQKKAKIAEGLNMASAATTAVSLYRIETGEWPANNAQAGLAATIETTHVRDLQIINDGVVEITIKSESLGSVADQSFLYSPAEGETGSVSWVCSPPGGLSQNLLPAQCRS